MLSAYAKHLISDRSTLNAMRLFEYMKAYCGPSFSLAEALPGIRQYFSQYEVDQYLSHLRGMNLIGRSGDTIHLRGKEYFIRLCNASPKAKSFQPPPSAIQNKTNFRDFVSALLVKGCVDTVSFSVKKKVRASLSGTRTLEGTSTNSQPSDPFLAFSWQRAVPLSIPFLSELANISKSSAGRLRQRAARTGAVANMQSFAPVKINGSEIPDPSRHDGGDWKVESPCRENLRFDSYNEFRMFQQHESAWTFRMFEDGTVWEQMPNMVAYDRSFFTKKFCTKNVGA